MGGKTGPNPTDRAKSGTKRSVLTDGAGIPLGIVVAGANRPDFKLLEATLESIPVTRPEPTEADPQHLCTDKGYDYGEVEAVTWEWAYTLHLRRRGEEITELREAGKRARRWVVERVHSWFNRFRRLLIRWDKYPEHYLSFLHFAAAIITFRAAHLTR